MHHTGLLGHLATFQEAIGQFPDSETNPKLRFCASISKFEEVWPCLKRLLHARNVCVCVFAVFCRCWESAVPTVVDAVAKSSEGTILRGDFAASLGPFAFKLLKLPTQGCSLPLIRLGAQACLIPTPCDQATESGFPQADERRLQFWQDLPKEVGGGRATKKQADYEQVCDLHKGKIHPNCAHLE